MVLGEFKSIQGTMTSPLPQVLLMWVATIGNRYPQSSETQRFQTTKEFSKGSWKVAPLQRLFSRPSTERLSTHTDFTWKVTHAANQSFLLFCHKLIVQDPKPSLRWRQRMSPLQRPYKRSKLELLCHSWREIPDVAWPTWTQLMQRISCIVPFVLRIRTIELVHSISPNSKILDISPKFLSKLYASYRWYCNEIENTLIFSHT